jgi:hypothetical protein
LERLFTSASFGLVSRQMFLGKSLNLPALQPYYVRKPCHPRKIYTKILGRHAAENLELEPRDRLALVKVHASSLLEGKLHTPDIELLFPSSVRTESCNDLDDHVNNDATPFV